jgi:hypothetical protein
MKIWGWVCLASVEDIDEPIFACFLTSFSCLPTLSLFSFSKTPFFWLFLLSANQWFASSSSSS